MAKNDQGKWIEGFYKFIGVASTPKAELWATKLVMKICKEKWWFGTFIEMHCFETVDLINEKEDGLNHLEIIIIKEFRTFMVLEIGKKILQSNYSNFCLEYAK